MSKPSKFSRRTGTVSKAKRMHGLDKYFRNTKVISNQAKKAASRLNEKIEKEELDYCVYDSKERAHAHREELKKKGKEVKKIAHNKFAAVYGDKKLSLFNKHASDKLAIGMLGLTKMAKSLHQSNYSAVSKLSKILNQPRKDTLERLHFMDNIRSTRPLEFDK